MLIQFLEIIAMVFMSRYIGEIAFEKGHSIWLYRFITFLFWLAFKFIGATIFILLFGNINDAIISTLILLLFPAIGYYILYLIVNKLPDIEPQVITSIYKVNCEILPVYERTIETSRIIKEIKKGELIEINATTDFNRFYKIHISPNEIGYIRKSSDISMKD